MNKSQRIYLSSGDTGNDSQDKYIRVKLEQDVETLEFMSMSLGTADVYQNYNADYGVLIGRVLANGGIGVPNAKISIFIPITDEDAQDPEVYSFYPYKTPRDKNNDGKRYNLLPRVSQINQETNQLEPKQAFGSFPIKEEIVGNLPFLDVYKKYYKYTALTNDAGDYMMFGVPIGTQVVHLSADITDIGRYSMNPAAMVANLGYSEGQFTDNNTRIKPSDDLNDLPNIETQEITVDVVPFWGDVENFEIGISRQDFRIRATLVNTFVMFGSAFTDSVETLRGWDTGTQNEIRDLYYPVPNEDKNKNDNTAYGPSISTKRIGTITEKIYTYPPEYTDDYIDSSSVDPENDMILVDPTNYSIYKRNGDFVFIINCNRDKVLTNDVGEEIPTTYDDVNGVFTKFRGFVTLEYTSQDLPMTGESDLKSNKTRIKPYRVRLKFPQFAGSGGSFDDTDGGTATEWRKQHEIFEASKFYSFSRFHGTTFNVQNTDKQNFPLEPSKFFNFRIGKGDEDTAEQVNRGNRDYRRNVGVILSQNINGMYNDFADFPYNVTDDENRFGANWLNLSIYFPQLGYMVSDISNVRHVRTPDYFHTQYDGNETRNRYFLYDNTMPLVAGQFNTKWFARSDLHWTDIIEVPLGDIELMRAVTTKGFIQSQIPGATGIDYRDGTNVPAGWTDPCPYGGGKLNGDSKGSTTDPNTYFYKGVDTANCIDFLYELGIVT